MSGEYDLYTLRACLSRLAPSGRALRLFERFTDEVAKERGSRLRSIWVYFWILAPPLIILAMRYTSLRLKLLPLSTGENRHHQAIPIYWFMVFSIIAYLGWLAYLLFAKKKVGRR
jgi:hypothetical protein